jgi:2-polyprenyl-3-methyl-5-hydroxy-6-metoxy-1,4-benzoquinol methylase
VVSLKEHATGRLIVVTSAYDEIAEWYDTFVGSGWTPQDGFFPASTALMGEVRGLRICDLACGQGRVARYLADQGAQVVGVDISEKLLDLARCYESAAPRGVTYVHADVERTDALQDERFDGVICNMALMDIPNLEPALRTVSRILRPGGWFVFSIIHPCYNPAPSGEQATSEGWVRTVSGYFTEGYWRSDTRTGPPGKVGSYHRMLSTYVNALSAVGLTIERLAEPQLTGIHAERRPVWNEVPAALVVRCRKPVAPAGGIA